MRLPAFLDTGAIYALADRNDADHASVRAVYFDDERLFVTHELVLVEAFSLVTKRLNKSAAIKVVGALRRSSRVEVFPMTDLLQAAWSALPTKSGTGSIARVSSSWSAAKFAKR